MGIAVQAGGGCFEIKKESAAPTTRVKRMLEIIIAELRQERVNQE
jgi:hypothetical protein